MAVKLKVYLSRVLIVNTSWNVETAMDKLCLSTWCAMVPGRLTNTCRVCAEKAVQQHVQLLAKRGGGGGGGGHPKVHDIYGGGLVFWG